MLTSSQFVIDGCLYARKLYLNVLSITEIDVCIRETVRYVKQEHSNQESINTYVCEV